MSSGSPAGRFVGAQGFLSSGLGGLRGLMGFCCGVWGFGGLEEFRVVAIETCRWLLESLLGECVGPIEGLVSRTLT